MNHWKLGDPSREYTYRDKDGKIIGIVCRFETGTDLNGKKKKETWPRSYCQNINTKEKKWKWKGFKKLLVATKGLLPSI